MKGRLFVILPLVGMLAGCFTVKETPYEPLPMSALPPNVTNVTVEVRGFAATLTSYVALQSFNTFYVPGHYGRHHYHPGFYETIPSTTFVPQREETDRFLVLAKDRFEAAGFVVRANPPDYVVSVDFSGPQADGPNAEAWRVAWAIGTLLLSDSTADTWSARLKIYDNRTGRVVFTRDYSERYGVTMFSPIPFFGLMCYDRTESDYMKCRCLAALTERVTAEASAFFANVGK